MFTQGSNAQVNHDAMIEECKKKYIKLPDYILECPDRTLKYRALLILSKGFEDRDHIITQCKREYEKIRLVKIEENNKKELENWKQFLSERESLYD